MLTPDDQKWIQSEIRGQIIVAIVFCAIALGIIAFTYACGPEILCYGGGGEPAMNGFGTEWCELDGNNVPSIGDTSLSW